MRKLSLFVISMLLLGCSSSVENATRFYVLPELDPVVVDRDESLPLMMVKKVELASYLESAGIVYRTSETEVIQARNNQWAESIRGQITQYLIQSLRQSQSKYWPVSSEAFNAESDDVTLRVSLDKFNGAFTGNAEVSGEWELVRENGAFVMSEVFSIEVPLEQDGYAALVSALSLGTQKLARDIAEKIAVRD
ncbi:hypothetical protein AL542_15325 [Grimontia hollisae]|nr:ABC-type transport auxiliary lipoprotein family protein [Grimontia hollisae]AMG31569.1 hypothetical protein AL542_15325 [Grimontia hollisae]MDF2185939.1 ABC-type transport auxiliary lipoprotein family protein [Grimontia hollisae]STO45327.1 ABC-type uncharacterized transport system, auxiliary component [Grimontia hollisae]STO57843.1 ABC-type uncharacterized transport system, auxiliary component [Grimontia hollisae]STQ76354.1 ABC-type uncharacterized transport system, auxiliary component [Gri